MRIQDHSPAPQLQDTTPARSGSSSSTSRLGVAPGHEPSHDQATLGASVVALTRNALAGPEVRSDLVAHYRAQIASGSYHVAASDIADAMLADPQSGLGTGDGG